jgi:UDP-2,4-diacetamido-2,4,6-trideoxy-beta-L-altropyranose hydrolase
VKVVIRADASANIGSGHIMRCLTLASELRARGEQVLFVSRTVSDALAARMDAAGCGLALLAQGRAAHGSQGLRMSTEDDARATSDVLGVQRCDCLIVDHYGLDGHWERALRPRVSKLVVIDDLANRFHDCDLLLDQNFYLQLDQRYAGLVPTGARCLLGPKYALLRPEFLAARLEVKVHQPLRLFVSGGGADRFGICERAIEALRILGHDAPGAEIVAGDDVGLLARLSGLARGLGDVRVHGFVDDVAALMARCTIALGAGGSSTWERAALGLPSLVVVVAENQRRMVQDLAAAQVAVTLGDIVAVSPRTLADAIAALVQDVAGLARLRAASLALVDALGATRVADAILES